MTALVIELMPNPTVEVERIERTMKIKSALASSPTARSRFRAIAPEWAALSDKLAELTAIEAKLIEEIRPLNERFAQRGDFATGFARSATKQDAPAKAVDHAPNVKKLLGDLTPAPKAPAQRTVFESHDRKRWRQLAEDIDGVRTAISLIHEPLKKAWLDGSAAYCRHCEPDYRTIASSLCATLIALGHAMVAHENFAKDIREQGVAWGILKPMSLAALGSPTDSSSEFSRALKWAIECGHLHIDDVPAEWAARRN
jgi:hypothetical protein